MLLAFPYRQPRTAVALNAARVQLLECLRFLRMGFPSLLLEMPDRG